MIKHGSPERADGTITSGSNIPVWVGTSEPLLFPALSGPLSTEALVIGGGIAGLTTAYCLMRNHIPTILIEDGLVGSGESGRTTAHLTHALDDRYWQIEKAFGEDATRTIAASHTAAINWIEETVKREKIECGFTRLDGYLFLHPTDKVEQLEKEFAATQRAGLSTTWLERVPGITGVNSAAIRFPQQAQFHIMHYLNDLAAAFTAMGGSIFTHSQARHITEHGCECNGYEIKAKHIVVATNSPVNDFITMHTKQVPYRTYVIAVNIPKGSIDPALWWDTGDQQTGSTTNPYHYVRLMQDGNLDLLIVGGEDHHTGQPENDKGHEGNRYEALVKWTRHHFPMAGEVVYNWSGQVLEPFDYLAFIGKNPGNENVYIITGDSGNGMTHGTIGGMMISEMIAGRDHPWEKIYSPKRLPLREAGSFLQNAFNVLAQYGDWISKADIATADELKPGEGAILGKGLKRFAVYKETDGKLQVFSAACPHMGCVVQWNKDEHSFDCPCHGSRFTQEGVVVNGPATANLTRVTMT